MVDYVKDAYKTIFEAERPLVVQWLKNRPELFNKAPRYSVYLGDRVRYVTIEEYFNEYALINPPVVETKNETLRKTIANLRCVQAGWAFGVPEDGRGLWLDMVVGAVMEKAQSS